MSIFKRLAGRPASPGRDVAETTSEAQSVKQRASDAQRQGRWAEAEPLWKRATELSPDEVDCWLQLGNMRNELGQFRSALAAFQVARSLEPAAAEPVIGIAGVHERSSRWGEALDEWRGLVRLLEDGARKPRPGDQEWLNHARIHAAISASMAGELELAQEITIENVRALPALAERPEILLIRARALRKKSPERARQLLRQCLERAPLDDAVRFELGSLALDDGDVAEWVEGAEAVNDALSRRRDDISFLWLLADLQDRLREWSAVCSLCDRMAELAPNDLRHLRRALAAAVALKDLDRARRYALSLARQLRGDAAPLQDLACAYEASGELDRARLLFRALLRIRTYTPWHLGRVIVLTAARRSLGEADRLLRRAISQYGRHVDLDRAYYNAAARSGNHSEALRRLRWFLTQHADDEDAQTHLGYVLANSIGLAEAERHFEAIATSRFQDTAALIGLAHMAMRKRDRFLVHERWANVVALDPDDTIARVEYARSAYELREFGMAQQICEEQLAQAPADVTMGEFYAWLLVAVGRWETAWNYLQSLRPRVGASWTLIEYLLLCAAQTGRMDSEFALILAGVPGARTRADAWNLYRSVRHLAIARREDLVPRLVEAARPLPSQVPWLAPYLQQSSHRLTHEAGFAAAVEQSWARTLNWVRSDIGQHVSAASNAEISALLARPSQTIPTVHIINKFEQPRGGSELHALDLAERLRKFAKVELWAPEMPHPHFVEAEGVRPIDPGQGRVPHGGVVIVVGVYFEIEAWIGRARAKRIIFLYNTFEAPQLFERIRQVYERTGLRSEVLVCSDLMRHEVNLPASFEPSPVDIEMFSPRPTTFAEGHRFTLGRHSRDVIEKHHSEDWRVYEVVTQNGGTTKLLGGTCMEPVFPKSGGIEFLQARSDGIVEFLQQLDCYYYNTSTWIEPWGRVVIEAMACGLPVLVSDRGGYAQVIEHEKNGLLFHTIEEAVAMMRRLATDTRLRQRLGAEARRTVEALLGRPALDRLVAFYLYTT